MSQNADLPPKPEPKAECFVIMPISDGDGYTKGHFQHVFDDIFVPACDQAGFLALKGDGVKQSNLIHLDIVQRLLDAPMAVCDLSSRNPNVLFELALRQAFDMPVALVQEVGTQPIFDIAPFRYTEYRKELVYHEVLDDQASIRKAIKDTYDAHCAGKGVNSIVKLLALGKAATIPTVSEHEASADFQNLILAELSQLRHEIREPPSTLSLRECEAAIAAMNITIMRAKYGCDDRYVDVTAAVANHVAKGHTSFLVANGILGGDPFPNKQKRLTVEYLVGGTPTAQTVLEGKFITLV